MLNKKKQLTKYYLNVKISLNNKEVHKYGFQKKISKIRKFEQNALKSAGIKFSNEGTAVFHRLDGRDYSKTFIDYVNEYKYHIAARKEDGGITFLYKF